MKLDNVYLSRSEKYSYKPYNFYFNILLILDLENVCLDTFFDVVLCTIPLQWPFSFAYIKNHTITILRLSLSYSLTLKNICLNTILVKISCTDPKTLNKIDFSTMAALIYKGTTYNIYIAITIILDLETWV